MDDSLSRVTDLLIAAQERGWAAERRVAELDHSLADAMEQIAAIQGSNAVHMARVAELEQMLGVAKSQDGGCISQAMKRAQSGESTAGDADLLQKVVSSLRSRVAELEADQTKEDNSNG